MLVANFAVNYKGRPYMEALSANRGLAVTLLGSALLVASMAGGGLSDLAEYLELVPITSDELQSDLLSLMAADFFACYAIEKAVARIFAYY